MATNKFDLSAYTSESSFNEGCVKIKGALTIKFVINWIVSFVYILLSLGLAVYLCIYILNMKDKGGAGAVIFFIFIAIGAVIRSFIIRKLVTPKVEMFKDYYVRRALEQRTDLKLYCHREEDFSYKTGKKVIDISDLAMQFPMPNGTERTTSNDYIALTNHNLNIHIMNVNGGGPNGSTCFLGFCFVIEMPKKLVGERVLIVPKTLLNPYPESPELQELSIVESPEFTKKFRVTHPISGNKEQKTYSLGRILDYLEKWEKEQKKIYGFADAEDVVDETEPKESLKDKLKKLEAYKASMFFTQQLAELLLDIRKTYNYVSLAVENNVVVLSVHLKKDYYEPLYRYGFKDKDGIMTCVDDEVTKMLEIVDPLLKYIDRIFPTELGN